MRYRLTQYAQQLEPLVGLDHDVAAVRVDGDRALIAATDSVAPVVDDAYDWGRIAATNALAGVHAMGGQPVLALNILAWPRETLPLELADEVLRGGMDVCSAAQCHLASGQRVNDPKPSYGLAVTGLAHPDRLLRNDSGRAGQPLSLTKPLGLGVLNFRHQATGEWFEEAVDVMTTLNATASAAAVAAGIRCGTGVAGFGLLGHLHKLARASGVTAVLDSEAVPFLDGAHEAVRDGFVPDGSRRNLDRVRPHADLDGVPDDVALLLADAQTSGGLLLAGEISGAPVIGELVPAEDGRTVVVR